MFSKVVVANRGAVAARVLRALNEMGIRSVAVYSEADAGAPRLELAVLRSEPFRAGRVHTGLIPEVLSQKKAA